MTGPLTLQNLLDTHRQVGTEVPIAQPLRLRLSKVFERKATQYGEIQPLMLQDGALSLRCAWFDPSVPFEALSPGVTVTLCARPHGRDPDRLVGAKIHTRSFTKQDGSSGTSTELEAKGPCLIIDGQQQMASKHAAEGTAPVTQEPTQESFSSWFDRLQRCYNRAYAIVANVPGGRPSATVSVEAAEKMAVAAMIAYGKGEWVDDPPKREAPSSQAEAHFGEPPPDAPPEGVADEFPF